MKDILIILFRTILGFILLTIAMKVMGKRDIGQLSIFDFLIVLSVSDIMIIGIENYNQSVWYFIVPLVVIVLLQKLVSLIELRITKIREKIDGKEKMIINKGQIVLSNMDAEKYNMNDLYTQLRDKDIRYIDEVEYAILETNGKLSVFTYAENKEQIFPLPLIVSGKIEYENLKMAGKDKKWLKTELKNQGLSSEKEVYGATLVKNNLKIVKFKKDLS